MITGMGLQLVHYRNWDVEKWKLFPTWYITKSTAICKLPMYFTDVFLFWYQGLPTKKFWQVLLCERASLWWLWGIKLAEQEMPLYIVFWFFPFSKELSVVLFCHPPIFVITILWGRSGWGRMLSCSHSELHGTERIWTFPFLVWKLTIPHWPSEYLF